MAAEAIQAVMIYITLAQAAKCLPPGRSGKPVHLATILRWITLGTKSPTGEVVHLRAIRMGGRWLTTREWLDDYGRRLTPEIGGQTAAAPTTNTEPQRSKGWADRGLARAGI